MTDWGCFPGEYSMMQRRGGLKSAVSVGATLVLVGVANPAVPAAVVSSAKSTTAAAARAAAPVAWFVPPDPIFYHRSLKCTGTSPYMALFAPGAPWRQAAAHIRVLETNFLWVADGPRGDLAREFDYLKRHGIALGLGGGVLTCRGLTGKVEGFAGRRVLRQVPRIARRVRRAGETVRYIGMDEPVFYGSIYSGRLARHWTPAHVAANATKTLRALSSAFPGLKVVDIEPLGGPPRQVALEIRRYKSAIEAFRQDGMPVTSFRTDVSWWALPPGALAALCKMLRSEHVTFGVICDGSGHTDAAWVRSAEINMARVRAAVGNPDVVVFQSWMRHPAQFLPENAAYSFTHLIDWYFSTWQANHREEGHK